MNWVAWKMLVGDRAKYFGLVFGITFATMLMTQQVSIFMGIIKRTGNQILEVKDASIWVMDNKVRFDDEAPSIPEEDLYRVRGVPGVKWGVKYYRGQLQARMENGDTRAMIVLGVDDSTLVGAPQKMLLGSLDDIRLPDAVIVDKAGYTYMWPGEEYRIGQTFEINDRRVKLVGICDVGAPFITLPVIYTRFSTVRGFLPRSRSIMNFILAEGDGTKTDEELCRDIAERTGLDAQTQTGFFWKTVVYFLGSTGIPINFGTTIVLGFIVGAAITGQTFYLFTIENLKQFGALKAMGVTNGRLIVMVLLQGLIVGLVGYGLGVGLTSVQFVLMGRSPHMAGLHLTWQAMTGVAGAITIIILLTSFFSLRKVLLLEPASVFK